MRKVPTILNYVTETVNPLIKSAVNQPVNDSKPPLSCAFEQYEQLLKKYEADLRYYSKLLFQYKMQCDALEMKLASMMEIEEEYEEMKGKYKYEEGIFLHNDKKDNEIFILRTENSNLKRLNSFN